MLRTRSRAGVLGLSVALPRCRLPVPVSAGSSPSRPGSIALPIGALLGIGPLASLPVTPFASVLAFGTVALLYLVTEELLTQAHEVDETPLLTSMFFVGFVALLMIEMLV